MAIPPMLPWRWWARVLAAGSSTAMAAPANTAPNPLNVSNTQIGNNIAQGGDNNFGSASVSCARRRRRGGGIANYAGGVATIFGSLFNKNQAISGVHNTAGGTGAVFANFALGVDSSIIWGSTIPPPTAFSAPPRPP